jgi:PAS domain S-box-containing protein
MPVLITDFRHLASLSMKSGFLEKLVARLDRVEAGEVQQILARLIREKGFLEKVFEALREGVIILDPHGTIGFVNQAACQFFGLDPERAVGNKLSSQVRGLDWDSLAKPGRSISRDLEVFYPENRYLNFYLAPIDEHAHSATSLGYVMLVRDLTSTRAEAEETLESERLNALTLLAAGVAHEIGNPLNSLDIHLQLLGRKLRKLPAADRPPLEESLATAREEIQRLDTILKQFLHAVRPTTPRRERHDLHALLHETLRLLEPELSSRHIAVELDLAAALPPALIDPGQFQQVFYNLIRNAYQALPATDGRITLRSQCNDYEYRITIEDNGSGISPEVMGAIFEPYRSTKPSGSGLGLLIVRRIVRQHGGEIEIASETHHGTRVIIHLPRTERTVRLLTTPAIEL